MSVEDVEKLMADSAEAIEYEQVQGHNNHMPIHPCIHCTFMYL
jgi:hypothetical protein